MSLGLGLQSGNSMERQSLSDLNKRIVCDMKGFGFSRSRDSGQSFNPRIREDNSGISGIRSLMKIYGYTDYDSDVFL